MKHIDLFSGIGGFALASEMVWDDVEHIFCDNEPFSQEVIKKHWPNSKIYGDIRTLTADAHFKRHFHREAEKQSAEGLHKTFSEPIPSVGTSPVSEKIDFLTGGFPCQPFSQAGARRGTADDRHLWPEMLRVIREFHPRWVIGENVGGLVTWSEGLVLEQIHVDLESEGYEVQAFIIPAVAVNAPHRRDRVWIVAHSNSDKHRGRGGQNGEKNSVQRIDRETLHSGRTSGTIKNASDTNSKRLQGMWEQSNGKEQDGLCNRERWNWNQNWSEVASRLCRVDDGIPKRLDRNSRLKGLGNAIVPQVAKEIMQAIKQIDG